MLASGTQLGPYEIVAPLGKGGMGEVYRAKDSRLDRDVAVKVLPTQFAQDEARLSRFQREAKAVAALSHPNILAIHDYGTDSGQTFAVMELLEGQTLRRRVAHGAIPWRKAAEIAVAIADGLAAAHGKGIIHRDLKPDNIFLTTDGHVKILDFGLARMQPMLPSGETPTRTYHPDQTEAGTILGTVGYMSPEQVRGKEVDARSDIFSLGCLIYEMVTGQRAFARDTAAETMTAILHDEPPELSNSGKKAPPELERVIQHCLEKNRDQRFQSARDLAFALKAILNDSDVSSRGAAASATWQTMALWILVATVLMGVAATAFLPVLRRSNDAKNGQVKESELPFESVAVLPFIYQSGDTDAEFLAEGIPLSVSTGLAQIQTLKVRPQSSVARVKEQAADDPFAAGKTLQVQAFVTGKIQKLGERLIVTWQLADVRSNTVLDGATYNRPLAELFQLQEDLAKEIAGKLRIKLTGQEQQQLAKRPTENLEAFRLYTLGLHHWHQSSEESLKKAIDYFERAIGQDSTFALAHTGLGRCYAVLSQNYWPPKETYSKARQALDRALELDPFLGEAHASLGGYFMYSDHDWAAAKRELDLALKFVPQASNAHHLLATYLAAQGRFEEAIAEAQRAKELEPNMPIRSALLGRTYYFAGRYDQAIAECEEVLALDQSFFRAYSYLSAAYTEQGRYQEAIEALQKAPANVNELPEILSRRGYANARWGQQTRAREVLVELQARAEQQFTPGFEMAMARIHAGLDENDRALHWLRKANEAGYPLLVFLKVDPTFTNLRSDPAFNALLQDIGLANKPTQARSASEGPDQPLNTLAVLPFDNQSTDPEAGYLGEDITYSLTDSLMRVRDLIVRPYGSAARYKPGSFDAKTAGRELQAQAVLRGSIQKRGDDVFIEVELMHVSENRRLWGNRYPGKLADRLALQQRIIQEVPEQLRLSLTGQEKQTLAKLPTKSLKAYELYIQARLEWRKRTRPGLENSIDLFRQATDLDPKFALAWAGLADAYRALQLNTDSPPKDFMPKAKAAAIKALEIDDQLAEAHTALASVAGSYEWDWSQAETRLQRALALNPNSAWTHLQYSQHLRTLGRFDEAQSHAKLAQELDPLSLITRTITGRHYYYAGQYDAAIDQYRKTLDIDPDYWVAHLLLGQAFVRKGQYEEAIAQFQKVRQLPGVNLEALASLGHLYALMGKTAEAQQVQGELKEISQQRYVPPYYFALIHAALGEKEQAFIWLDKAYEDRNHLIMWLKDEPMFESLKGDPRFQKIVADMKFPK